MSGVFSAHCPHLRGAAAPCPRAIRPRPRPCSPHARNPIVHGAGAVPEPLRPAACRSTTPRSGRRPPACTACTACTADRRAEHGVRSARTEPAGRVGLPVCSAPCSAPCPAHRAAPRSRAVQPRAGQEADVKQPRDDPRQVPDERRLGRDQLYQRELRPASVLHMREWKGCQGAGSHAQGFGACCAG